MPWGRQTTVSAGVACSCWAIFHQFQYNAVQLARSVVNPSPPYAQKSWAGINEQNKFRDTSLDSHTSSQGTLCPLEVVTRSEHARSNFPIISTVLVPSFTVRVLPFLNASGSLQLLTVICSAENQFPWPNYFFSSFFLFRSSTWVRRGPLIPRKSPKMTFFAYPSTK